MAKSAPSRIKRRKMLVHRRLQLDLTLAFVGISALGLGFQFVLLLGSMSRMAMKLPGDASIFFENMPAEALRTLLTSCALVLPMTILFGILLTFRYAGPMKHFTSFLEALERGEKPDDVVLRKEDQLQDFAELLNRATAQYRRDDSPPSELADAA